MPKGVRMLRPARLFDGRAAVPSVRVLTLIDWFANQSIYGTPESRRSAPQPDHRRAARRDPEARHRRSVDPTHRERSGSAGGPRAPLLRVEGRSPDRDRRSDRRGSADAAPRRARRARSRARPRPRSRLPLHRATRRPDAQRAVRRDRRRRAPSPAAPPPLRRLERRDRRRADGAARPTARLPRPARRECRPGNDADLFTVRGGCHLAIRFRRDQSAPAPPHDGGAGRTSPRSESWKS